MLNTMISILLFAAIGQVSVEEDFAVLEKRTSKHSAVKQACERIDKAFPDGDEACIKRLVSIWADNQWSQKESILLACNKADDKTGGIIMDAVRKVAAVADDRHKKRRLGRFFGKPARALSRRLIDPEPLFQLAEESHEWGNICHFQGSQALKDKYAIKSLLACDSEDSGGGSIAGGISDAAIPTVRKAMRKLPRKGYMSESFHGTVSTLVDLGDTEIIPDLEAILRDPKLPVPQQDIFQQYLVKLKHQDSPSDLLKVIETEREGIRTINYATLRYLWLTKDAKVAREALRKNQQESVIRGYNLAQAMLAHLFGEKLPPSPLPIIWSDRKYDIRLSILNHDEFREYHKQRELIKGDPSEFLRWHHQYSVEGIVQAATKSQPENEKPQPVAP